MVAESSLVYLGLGGNSGAVAQHFERARQALNSHSDITLLRASSHYTSKAWGGGVADVSMQDDYLNQVVELETTLSAVELLRYCQQLELEAGRNHRAERWTSRPLDIDLLLYGQQVVRTTMLELPHPRMLRRAFVLKPLAELSPELQIPGAVQVFAALQALSTAERNSTQWLVVGSLTTNDGPAVG